LLKDHFSDNRSSTLLSNYVGPTLSSVVTPEELHAISDSFSNIDKFSPSQVEAVRTAFAVGYGRQMKLLVGFSAAGLLASLLLIERKQRVVK